MVALAAHPFSELAGLAIVLKMNFEPRPIGMSARQDALSSERDRLVKIARVQMGVKRNSRAQRHDRIDHANVIILHEEIVLIRSGDECIEFRRPVTKTFHLNEF